MLEELAYTHQLDFICSEKNSVVQRKGLGILLIKEYSLEKIVYHSRDHLSLKTFDNTTWKGKIIFKKIIKEILVDYNYMVLAFERQVYHYLDFEKSIHQIFNNCKAFKLLDLYHSSDFFRFSFSLTKEMLNDEILESINDLWLLYEHKFIMVHNDTLFDSKKTNEKLFRLSSKEAVELTTSIVLYNGIEEDVSWIRKSEKIMFPNIESIINNEPRLG